MITASRAMLLTAGLVLLVALSCGGGQKAATVVVDSTADSNTRDDRLTLREARTVAALCSLRAV